MKLSSLVFRHSSLAMAAVAAIATIAASGCVHYVDPGSSNTAGKADIYTRAETRTAEQRLVDAMCADSGFAQFYAAKVAQKGGAVPALQVAYFDTAVPGERMPKSVVAARRAIEDALRASGRFVLTGDIDAADYVLHGLYDRIPDGRRDTHQLALRLHDTTADIDVWTGIDEIAKE